MVVEGAKSGAVQVGQFLRAGLNVAEILRELVLDALELGIPGGADSLMQSERGESGDVELWSLTGPPSCWRSGVSLVP
jgi:hypothetical protein